MYGDTPLSSRQVPAGQRNVPQILIFLCDFEGFPSTSGGYSEEDTPVPIPNTEVKLFCADDTWRVTARESRTLPDMSKPHENS